MLYPFDDCRHVFVEPYTFLFLRQKNNKKNLAHPGRKKGFTGPPIHQKFQLHSLPINKKLNLNNGAIKP
jgi:hypothetical protein